MTFEKLSAAVTQLYTEYKLPHNIMTELNSCLRDVCFLEYGEELADYLFNQPIDDKGFLLQEDMKN